MKPSIRCSGEFIGLIVAAVALYCQQPTEPDPISMQRGIESSGTSADQIPEEEILGSVFTNGGQIDPTSREYSVRLTPMGSGACLFRANSSSICLSSSTIPVMPKGSRALKSAPMWGWFNNLDTDNNPCRGATTDKTERHDLNHNQLPDDGGIIEQHCVKPGRYKVEILRNGSVFRTRIVDHFRVSGTLNFKLIESSAGTQANDTYVHTEISTIVPVSNNLLAIDNPATSTPFAPGDTVVHNNVPVRFDAGAMTTWNIASPGRLMNRMYFNLEFSLADRTEYWNPDLVIRTRAYTLGGSSTQQTFRTRTEIATPSDPTGNTNRNSPERRIVVQSAVATVTVSPSSATIAVNGTVSLSATLRDANGNVLTGRTITWSSSNTTVATVTGSGQTATVTGKANGTATIMAASEGKSGSSAITVGGADGSAAAGNTLPASFENGSAVSVTVSMQNTGSTTWTSGAGYALDLSRDLTVWAVTLPPVGSTGISPGATKAFAFTLRTDNPERRGTTACFFQMQRNLIFFGAENGRDINVTGPKITASPSALASVSIAPLGFDPGGAWVQGAVSEGTTRIPLDAAVFRDGPVATFAYGYAHEVAREIDVVFKYEYDPALFEPLPVEPTLVGITIESGLGAPGEYWVRFTGTVPQGTGLIAGLPFRLIPGARAPRQSTALLTIYHRGD